MQFISQIQNIPAANMLAVYPEVAFKGQGQNIPRGSYNVAQLEIKNIKSVKLEAYCSLTVYENPDKSGRSETYTASIEDISAIGFTPKSLFVTVHAKCFKDGKEVQTLTESSFNSCELKTYEKVTVPKGMSLLLCENPKDRYAVHIYSDDTYVVDGKLDVYNKALLLMMGYGDFSMSFNPNRELSDSELMSIVGGAMDNCKFDLCAADACAIDSPCVSRTII